MSVKMQVMFTGPRIFAFQNAIRPSARFKKTRADAIIRLNKENKYLFGDLLETKKEKAVREKRKKKTEALERSEGELCLEKTRVDTEIHFLHKSQARQLSKIKFVGKTGRSQTKTIIIISEPKINSNVNENLETVSAVQNSAETSTVDNSGLVPDLENLGIAAESSTSNENKLPKLNLPSNTFLNQLTSFSYIDVKRDNMNIPEVDKPLSISPYSDRSKLIIPSVTRILNKTMSAQSKLNLDLWKQRMILQMGEEGFENYSKELLLNGKQFHSSIQNYLIKEPFEIPSTVEKSWQSVQHVLKDVTSAKVIESHVVHPKLLYRGIVDCVAVYRGDLCVIDWKKSDKPKNSIENTFDAPVQVASYIGALNFDTNYNFQVQKGLVVVGYTNGDPASVHEMNSSSLDMYWKLWLRRLQQYYLDLKNPQSNLR